MTAKEKALVRLAIKLIHAEDDYQGGMNILWKLIGETPPDTGEIKQMDLKEIIYGHDGGQPIDPTNGMETWENEEEKRPVGFDYKNKQQ